ncbi:metallophosphoesterase [Clostridium sp. DSM 100503]|uniref:metallophosphoesterase family protein n=1 Tax=Clostridium sp. DSM 100503 TaxID=2963282 RepID=UPI00214A3581|nr:metallophosphoesterase [Clostridium sp. DSM 100503]MCR1950483.1 metallophosphoesterase [Clostridium sp. DSM 100503]
MKRFKLIIITITVILLGAIYAIYINESKFKFDAATVTSSSNADLSFAVLGDVHENINHLQEAINDLYTINPKMDALVLNGDAVDQGLDEQYNSMQNTLNKNKDLLPEIIIKNIGNHEFFDYNIETNSNEQVQSFINKYLKFSGEEKVYHDKWVNVYHFISLGSEDGNSETINSVTASISDEQLEWFKEKLAENYKKGKPIFVFLHQHLDYGENSWIGTNKSEEIKQILSQYPEVIMFASHTHSNLNENSLVLNKPFTIVNTGAVHYTIIPDSNEEKGYKRETDYIKGVYVEVNGNNVTVKGRDIKEKQWIFSTEISN